MNARWLSLPLLLAALVGLVGCQEEPAPDPKAEDGPGPGASTAEAAAPSATAEEDAPKTAAAPKPAATTPKPAETVADKPADTTGDKTGDAAGDTGATAKPADKPSGFVPTTRPTGTTPRGGGSDVAGECPCRRGLICCSGKCLKSCT
ncbi:MAG: hypothetical protein R3B72_30145 [Polyangiaceae bacterium]